MGRQGQTYFNFKQFKIDQPNTGMKVCTDACLFGAIMPLPNFQNPNILDIGAGTGLLSLMVAQRLKDLNIFGTRITAIEPEPTAFTLCQQNVLNATFGLCITPKQVTLQAFVAKLPTLNLDLFDLIITNPPFFANHLATEDANRQQALHQSTLTLVQLASGMAACLKPNGTIVVLLPPYQHGQLKGIMATHGLYLTQLINVYTSKGPSGKHLRAIGVYSFGEGNKRNVNTRNIAIRNDDNQIYTPDFSALLAPFYLHL